MKRLGFVVTLAAALLSQGTVCIAMADEISTTVIYAGADSARDPGPGTAYWVEDDIGWWYRHIDGSYTSGDWEQIEGLWYYFNSEGYMMADAWVDGDEGMRYRLGPDGAMLTSMEIEVDGLKYTVGEDGNAVPETPPKSESELQAEAIAADIVASITDGSMTKPQKANAIYNWVRGNMTYSHSGPKGDPAEGALYGFRRRYGNCYEYYAMSKYLLEAAGMPNIMVTRASDGDHFWNLVNVDGVWYHFDTTPRSTGGRWCLVTTGTLRATWGAHNFDVAAYPQTP